MALKAVRFLATIGLVFSEGSHCSGSVEGADPGSNSGRDCTCADRAFAECDVPHTDDQLFVLTWQDCKFQCDLYASIEACDWWLFNQANGMDRNCHLFGPGRQSMPDYLSTCNIVEGPVRNVDDACFANDCNNDVVCPGGCASCSNDACAGYIQTDCSKNGLENNRFETIPSLEDCQKVMTYLGSSAQEAIDSINYYTYDQLAWTCKGYEDGLRSCANRVALQTVPIATIDMCQS